MTLAIATVQGHLYRPVEVKQNDKGSYALISFYTKDKDPKTKESAFTSWSGFVHGPQAEWLAPGKKGCPVLVSGTIRVEKRVDDKGKEHVGVTFTRINEARLLERDEEAAPVAQAPVSRPKISGMLTPAISNDQEVPF